MTVLEADLSHWLGILSEWRNQVSILYILRCRKFHADDKWASSLLYYIPRACALLNSIAESRVVYHVKAGKLTVQVPFLMTFHCTRLLS